MVVRKLVVWISICCMDVRNGKGLDFLAFKISLTWPYKSKQNRKCKSQ